MMNETEKPKNNMKTFQYYRRPNKMGLHSWQQVVSATMTYGAKTRYIALFILSIIAGGIYFLTILSVIGMYGLEEMRSRFHGDAFIFVPWLAAFPLLVGAMMYPQFVTVRQLGVPAGIKILFRVNVGIAFIAGLLPFAFLYFCIGNEALLVLSFYVLAMSYLPAKLVRMHYFLTLIGWGLYACFMMPAFFPGSIRITEFSPPVPLIVGLLLAAVAFWLVTWWRVCCNWPLDKREIEEVRYKYEVDLHGKPDYESRGLWSRVGSPLEYFQYNRISRLSAKSFLGRMRLGLLAYSDPKEWLTGSLWTLFVFFLIYRGITRLDGASSGFAQVNLALVLSVITLFSLTSLSKYMARWRDTIALHRFYPMSNRTAIREAAIQFAFVMVRTWFFIFAVSLGFVYLADPTTNLFLYAISFLAFSAAFLCFQYGSTILLMIVLERGFTANQNAWVIMTLAFWGLLWYWIGWPITIVVLLLGLVVSFGAYRRLHTVEPDQIGEAESFV